MTNPDRRVAAAATGQLGAFTRVQAHDAGLDNRQLRRRVQSGILDQVGLDTFRSTLAHPSKFAELVALCLDLGQPCWASGPTAAALHRFDGFRLLRPFHVTLLRGRRATRSGLVIHTTTELELIDRARVDQLAVTSPARTLIDLARHENPDRLTAALDAGLRDGGFNEDLLHRRIVALRGKGRHGIPTLLDVIAGSEVTRGAHSWLEREHLRITAAAGLPRPQTQRVLAGADAIVVTVRAALTGSV